jgi:hypothetical protein
MKDLEDDVHELIENSAGSGPAIYIEWCRHDIVDSPRIDARAESQRVVEALERRGYRPTSDQAAGDSGWGGWRLGTDRVLDNLHPIGSTRAPK